MNAKRGISLLVLVASIALFAGACSSDSEPESKKADKSSTSTTEKKGDESSSTSEQPTTSLGDEAFTTAINKVNSEIEAAGTDPCDLLTALSSEPPAPGNPTQAKQLVETYSNLLKVIGGAVTATSPDSAKVLEEASAQIHTLGETKKFAADLFESKEFSEIMNSEKVSGALAKFTELTQKCAPATTEGSTPQG